MTLSRHSWVVVRKQKTLVDNVFMCDLIIHTVCIVIIILNNVLYDVV